MCHPKQRLTTKKNALNYIKKIVYEEYTIMLKKFLVLAVLPLMLSGCADNINSDHYSSNQAGKISTVSQCTVLSVRQVGVSDNTGAGTVIGGLAGGVAGSTIGHGYSANALGAIGGALVGGLVGNAAEKGLTSQTGLEYIVKLDNGQVISITQGTGQPLNVGQRCLVLFGSTNRVIAQ